MNRLPKRYSSEGLTPGWNSICFLGSVGMMVAFFFLVMRLDNVFLVNRLGRKVVLTEIAFKNKLHS